MDKGSIDASTGGGLPIGSPPPTLFILVVGGAELGGGPWKPATWV